MKPTQFLTAPVLSLALAATCGLAGAQSLTMTGQQKTTNTYWSTDAEATPAGQYALGARELTTGSSTFWAYCIDPLTSAPTGANTYSGTNLDSYLDGTSASGYASQIARTSYTAAWGTTALSNSSLTQAKVKQNLTELFSYAYTDSLTSDLKSAAFGWAVWEIVTQDWTAATAGNAAGSQAFVRGSGRMQSYGSVNNQGDTLDTQTEAYLTALSNNTWSTIGLGTAQNWTYSVFIDTTSPYYQTFLSVTPGGTQNQTPIPGTLALAGLGLLGAARISRRKTTA